MSGVALRAASDGDPEAGPVMVINFIRFNEWTEIDSLWEGRFMEQFAPGSVKKTFRERTPKVLFQHGMDPQIGDKPMGPVDNLREQSDGAWADVPLLDTPYVRSELLPGIEAGLYGASFRFKVMREEIVDDPKASDANPHGLPERTVKEAQVMEFGPVTFPAYEGTSAGTRSLTDDFIMRCFSRDPERLQAMLDRATDLRAERSEQDQQTQEEQGEEQHAPSESDAGTESHLTDERREIKPPTRRPIYGTRRKETSKPWLLGPSKSTKRS
jgi:phage head maturation protease